MNAPNPSPLAVALGWVSRITSIAILMVAPGILGGLLDARLGSGWLAPAGLALGLAAGLAVLLQLTKAKAASTGRTRTAEPGHDAPPGQPHPRARRS